MTKIASAFSSIFSDDEWFNKVLVGGFYLLLVPLGIGLVMMNGFFTLFAAGRATGERSMPYWRNFGMLFRAGLPSGFFSLIVLFTAVIAAIVLFPSLALTHVILLTTVVLTVNSIIVIRRLPLIGLAVSMVLVMLAVSFGWMWIVVGWPLLIFLSLLVQIQLLSMR